MRLAWALTAVTFALCVVDVMFVLLNDEIAFDHAVANLTFVAPSTAFAVVGGLIAARHPRNSVGWICLAIGLLFATVMATDALATWGYDQDTLPRAVQQWLAWFGALWVPAFGLMGTQLPLRLPDGRALWPRYARVCAWVLAGVTVVMFLQPNPPIGNPTEVGAAKPLGVLFLLIPLLSLGAIASVVVRYRRAASLEKHQLRWVAFGAVIFAGLYGLALIGLVVGGVDDTSRLGIVLTSSVVLSYVVIPVAIGFAVLRRRLYDIDLVINRALVYTALTVTLGAAYLGTVLVFQLVLAPLTSDSGIAVAASTLAVAALFRPARTRIQAAVDRRFFRRRYDAVRTLETFGARLREDIDLDSLSDELCAAVAGTMQPAHISVWMAQAPSSRERSVAAMTASRNAARTP